MKRRLLAALAGLILFGGGFIAGRTHSMAPATASSLWADYCTYSTEIHSYPGNNTATVLVAMVAKWDSYLEEFQSVTDYAARQAVADFDCEYRP